jgi:hypothetical protein
MKQIALFAVFSVAAIGTTSNATTFNYCFINSEENKINSEETNSNFEDKSRIYLQDGQIFVDGELQHNNFSIMQSKFEFLYLYIPKKGLFIISNNDFEGANQAGNFKKDKLAVEIEGISLLVKSSTKILPDTDETIAWVKYDPNFSLNTKAVIVGYGEDTKAPYKWKNQMKFNED